MSSQTFLLAVARWSVRLRLYLAVSLTASAGIDTSNAPPAWLTHAASVLSQGT